MKKLIEYLSVLLAASFVIVASCSKDKNDDDDPADGCKTCKAFSNGSQPEVTKEVCGEAAMTDFRAQYAGREISCF